MPPCIACGDPAAPDCSLLLFYGEIVPPEYPHGPLGRWPACAPCAVAYHDGGNHGRVVPYPAPEPPGCGAGI